jgi:hypothetical protein
MLGKSTSVGGPKRCIDKAILCSGTTDVDHISGEILNSLERQSKMCIHAVLEDKHISQWS